MTNRLYRFRTNRLVSGVCGGIGELIDVDPTIIRLMWVLLGLLEGAGLFAYLILAIIVPEKPEPCSYPHHQSKDNPQDDAGDKNNTNNDIDEGENKERNTGEKEANTDES